MKKLIMSFAIFIAFFSAFSQQGDSAVLGKNNSDSTKAKVNTNPVNRTIIYQNLKDTTKLKALKQRLMYKYLNEYDCFTKKHKKLISPTALDKYFYYVFGKVALDNEGYVDGGPAFSISFDNDEAIISGNYSAVVEKHKSIVWNLGLKAESDDGTLYLFNGKQTNYGIGIKGGISILQGSNKFFWDPLDDNDVPICQRAQDLRSDTMRKLLKEYEQLLIHTDTVEINKAIIICKKEIDSSRSKFDLKNPSEEIGILIKSYDSLIDLKKRYDSLIVRSDEEGWANEVTTKDIDAYDKHIVEKYATGHRVRWWDIGVEFKNDDKNVLDLSDTEDYVTTKPFFRFNVSSTFNEYRLTKHNLLYYNIGLSLGYGYGYDLLSPNNYQLDDSVYYNGVKRFNKVGDKIKAFNTSLEDNATFDKKYLITKATWVIDGFFGAKKVVGLEFSGEIGMMLGKKDSQFPFGIQGGLLFSPIPNKNNKTSEGVFGLIVGLKDVNLKKGNKVTIENFFAGIRVGIPLSSQLTRKGKSDE